jgi:hypothetical protein
VRKSLLIGVVVVAGLALSACGSSPAAKRAAINEFVGSFGSSPDVQVHLTAGFTGPTSANSARIQRILKEISMDVRVSNPTGAPLSQAGGTADSEILFNYGATSFIDLREVDSNLYVKVDIVALAAIPGVNLPTAEAAELELVIGGRWFELPKTLFNSLVHTSKVPKAQLGTDQAVEAKVLDALSNLIDTTSSTTLPNGYSETGTLASVEQALLPALSGVTHRTTTPTAPKGTYTLTLTTSGSTVTGASISITAPYETSTMATGTLTATVAHDHVTIAVPSPVTTITPSLLEGLGLGGALASVPTTTTS